MKKILSSLALLALAVNCFATGNLGVNPYQSGVISVVTNGASTLFYTNQFPLPYQSVPVVILYNTGNTAATPLTNSVTTTNFIVEVATPTNTTIAWQAYIGTPRFQAGTNSTLATVSTNIPFPYPYAQTPVVQCQQYSTNSAAEIAVTGITLTNFTVLCNLTEGFSWGAFGIAPAPSQSASTAPGLNDVKY